MLTERQEIILDFVREYQRTHGVTPSTREVARRFECSQPTALKHLRVLARKGQLEKLADGKWGLSARTVQGHLFVAPVYGTIPAGLPGMQEQQPDETLPIDPAIFGVRKPRPGHFWFLRVKGDSMNGAGILDGDLVALVRREPRPGEIIAALVDETTSTLKRFVRERGRTLLRAENPRYPDLAPAQLECQGVAVGVIRRKPA
ncbi:MAG TPA: transcriptional repressor LexA [Lacunisphaera sp.]|jgi:repressor LexA|nr:transcriptional repressor LexA [Lacunisphaera sp.]